MSKTAKTGSAAKGGKNDPKIMAMLNNAENSKRNLYIFNNQVYSAFVAREIVNNLVDRGAEILHNNYLMRQKMPYYLSEIYTLNIKQVVEVDKISHDTNDNSNPHKRYEEDAEPLAIPSDNYMSDWIKVGQKKQQSIAISETKTAVEVKPSAKKEQRVTYQKIQSKTSLVPQSDRTNQSINPIERESLLSGKMQKSQRRSKSNISDGTRPISKKSIRDYSRLVPLPQPKIIHDELIDRFRQEQARVIEEERLKKKEMNDVAEMKAALRKKIDLLEKSVFKKQYTYDFDGGIIEIKNRHPPKKDGFHMKLGFNIEYDQKYLEKLDSQYHPEAGIMFEVAESKGPPVFRYKPKTYGKAVSKVVEVDEELFKYEELLRAYGLIGYGAFHPSMVTEKMVEEIEKRRQANIIDYITPKPGVKIIEKDRVKENTTAVPKYSETGFPLISKSVYEDLKDKSADEIKYLNIDEMSDPKDLERALMEKEKRFRKLLDGLYPPQKKLQNKTRKISEIASFLDLNPLESQDLEKQTISLSSNKENNDKDSEYKGSVKSSNRSHHKVFEKSHNEIKFGDGIQERIEVVKGPPRRISMTHDRAISTPSRPQPDDSKLHLMEKYYGKEELFSKRKNRKLYTASKIPKIKKPGENSDLNNTTFLMRGTDHGLSDISWISHANKTYIEEVYGPKKKELSDHMNVNNQNLLQLLNDD